MTVTLFIKNTLASVSVSCYMRLNSCNSAAATSKGIVFVEFIMPKWLKPAVLRYLDVEVEDDGDSHSEYDSDTGR